MKKLLLSTLVFLSFMTLFSQAPHSFRYQSVVRNSAGELLPDHQVGLKISILKDSPTGLLVFSETYSLITSAQGLINLSVGTGNPSAGTIENIDWGNGNYFLRIDVDITGGINYEFLGTSQLLSVPYALYAETSGNGGGQSELYWERNGYSLYYNMGNVGIGTDSPLSLFNIIGYIERGTERNMIQIHNTSENALSYAGIKLKAGYSEGHSVIQDYSMTYSASPAYDFAGFLNLSNSNRGVMIHANSATGVIKFYTGHNADAGAGYERFRIDGFGNVGIGTQAPAAKLEIVDGDIYINDIDRGIIMKSPDGQCWRGTLDNSGTLQFNAVACP
jgi:hypothetical protein